MQTRIKANESAGSSGTWWKVVIEQLLKMNTEMLFYFMFYMCAFVVLPTPSFFLKVNVASQPKRLYTPGTDSYSDKDKLNLLQHPA